MALFPGSVRPLTNSDAIDVAINDGAGNQLTGFDSSRPATSTITTVAASATSVTLLAANPARRRLVINNHSGSAVFVAFAATATATAYTYKIPANSNVDGVLNDYTGIVTGIWNTATGNAIITEIST